MDILMSFDWRTGWTTRALTTGSGLEDTLEMLQTLSLFTMDTSSPQLTGNCAHFGLLLATKHVKFAD
jgi:hypothetical protein